MRQDFKDLQRWLQQFEAILSSFKIEEVNSVLDKHGITPFLIQEVEEGLRNLAAKYCSLFNSTADGIIIHNLDGQILQVNDAYCRMSGYSREELVSMRIGKIDVMESEGEINKHIRKIIKSGGHARFESRHRRRDGSFFDVDITALHMDKEGDRMAVFIRDISGRKETEAGLREAERRYRELVRLAPSGIYEIDLRQQKFISVNDAICQMTGYSRQELMDMNPTDMLAEESRMIFQGRVKECMGGKQPERNVEYRVRMKDGRYLWVLLNVTFTNDESGRPVGATVVAHDITNRKESEVAQRHLNDALEQRVIERTAEVRQQADQLRALAVDLSRTEQRERKRLARVLHDHIQQLLVAARMKLEWIRREEHPEKSRETADGLDAILKEALAASRSLTLDLSPPALHEAGLAGGLSWLASRMLEKNQFVVHLRADGQAEPHLEEMRFLLFECVRELLFNIIKHAGVEEAQVFLSRTAEGLVQVTVSDSGKGFDPDRLLRRRSDEVTFGLFSIQQRLAHIRGSMEIESKPGRGTKITLTVPAGPPPAVKKEMRARPPLKVRPRRRKKQYRVLIVDDHEILREGLMRVLQLEPDIEVVGEAADGPRAIQLAEELVPDVVIMDVNLGEMSGIEATRQILGRLPKTKVLGLSMHVDGDIARAMRDAGATAFLSKGGPSEDLVQAIRASRKEPGKIRAKAQKED